MSRKDTEIDTKSAEMIVIGDFLFVRETRELRANDGETTILRDRSAELLACLAANANEIVPEDGLMEAAWPGSDVTRDTLEQCVDDIRRALADTDHDLIETFPEQGYRLNAQPVAETVRQQAADDAPPDPPPTQGQRTALRGLAALLFVLLLLALVLYMMLWPGARTPPEAAATSRFAILTVDTGQGNPLSARIAANPATRAPRA